MLAQKRKVEPRMRPIFEKIKWHLFAGKSGTYISTCMPGSLPALQCQLDHDEAHVMSSAGSESYHRLRHCETGDDTATESDDIPAGTKFSLERRDADRR
jgi:hypothetical protein